jgi:hypothetical protein
MCLRIVTVSGSDEWIHGYMRICALNTCIDMHYCDWFAIH